MTKEILPFGPGEHPKLAFSAFPTIRRDDKYGNVGDEKTVKQGPKGSRDELGVARIVAKETVCINDERFSDQFFCYDTGAKNWDEAFDSLCSHYDSVIDPGEELTLYWSVWTEKYE